MKQDSKQASQAPQKFFWSLCSIASVCSVSCRRVGKKIFYLPIFMGRGFEGEKVLFARVWRRFNPRGAYRVWNMFAQQSQEAGVCFPTHLSLRFVGFLGRWIIWLSSQPGSKGSASHSQSLAWVWEGPFDSSWSSLIPEGGDFQPLGRKISCFMVFLGREYILRETCSPRPAPRVASCYARVLLSVLCHLCVGTMKIYPKHHALTFCCLLLLLLDASFIKW